MSIIYNRRREKWLRQQLRNHMPDAEVLLWMQLKGRQVLGFKFRRQYSVGPFVIDFYCPQLRLGVELDGDSHFAVGAADRDQHRQRYIESFGIRVIRYVNTDIYENMDGVLENLVGEMERRIRKNPPWPPLKKGGERSGSNRAH